MPTGGERLVWAQGDGSTLEAYDTPFGKIGGLICWENYMPLARYAMYAWGTQIYVATTWDRGQPWLSTLRHIANPDGEFVAGPLREQEGILYAEVDPAQLRGPKWMIDVAGHYARPHVFQLTVNREPRRMIRTEGVMDS